MAVTVPNALALATIADGSAIVASDHRNNYQAVQVGVNGLIAMFAAAPTKGDLLVSTGGGNFDRLPVGTNGQAIVADSSQPLGMKWGGGAIYRKTTAKVVNTSGVATDLLNGEITVAAGAMGASGLLRLTAWGDWLQNSGGATPPPRIQLVLGGTTLLDTGLLGSVVGVSASRAGWRIQAEILNLGVANAQASWIRCDFMTTTGGAGVSFVGFTTGEGSNQVVIGATTTSGLQIVAEGVNPSTAVDTTAAKVLALNTVNGSASATYETKLLGALVEIL